MANERAVPGEPINIEFTDEEMDLIQKAADKLEMPLEEYVKTAGLKSAEVILKARKL